MRNLYKVRAYNTEHRDDSSNISFRRTEGDDIAETKDLILIQAYNGHVTVVDKSTGTSIIRMTCPERLSKEQLKFIASDCQKSYTKPSERREKSRGIKVLRGLLLN